MGMHGPTPQPRGEAYAYAEAQCGGCQYPPTADAAKVTRPKPAPLSGPAEAVQGPREPGSGHASATGFSRVVPTKSG